MRRSRALQPTTYPREEITVTPSDVCELIVFCNAVPWGKVGAVVAAFALTYGVAAVIALVVYMYRFRGRPPARR
jgi:hypothetical protein